MLTAMSRWPRATWAAALALLVSSQAHGQAAVSYYEEQGQLIRSQRNVATLGAGLFGDSVNLYTGALEFAQTDVSVPGNSKLPVAVGRRLSTGASRLAPGHFGDWDLDIPHLQGVFSKAQGWKVDPVSVPAGTTVDPDKRCSQFAAPPDGYSQTGTWQFPPEAFWSGNYLHVPGAGTQEILSRAPGNALQPSDGYTYPLVTAAGWQIRCLSSLAPGNNEAGEGFLVVSPDGTQYRFDWMVSRDYPAVRGGGGSARLSTVRSAPATDARLAPMAANGELMFRKEVWILPTQITDRYGNTVVYTYDTTNPWQLQSIVANDGRRLDLEYAPGTSLVQNVRMQSTTDGTRTWTYGYATNGATATLSSVTLPDASQWTFNGANLQVNVAYLTPPIYCEDRGQLATDSLTKMMTHPSGAVGSFTLTSTLHGRSHVDACNVPTAPPVVFYGVRSLTNKTLSGPGLAPQTWTYDYGTASGGLVPCTGCSGTKVVTVTDPRNVQARHTFGNRSKIDEGLLLKVEIGTPGSPVRTTQYRYRAPTAGSYPDPIGVSPTFNPRGDGYISTRHNPQDQRVISQQGTTFTWEATEFDVRARPTTVTKSGPGITRTEATTYEDNSGKWVIGQIKRLTISQGGTTRTEVENAYNPTSAAHESTRQYGRPATLFTYHPAGTDAAGLLATRTDGRSHTTFFNNYKRGVPQSVSYPNGTSESAVLNDFGYVTSVTSAASHTTSYGYDDMGRLSSITPPAGWTGTSLTFAPSSATEYGLPPGHWTHTVTQGNAVAQTYLDALWRPIMTRTYDASQPAATRKVVVKQFDADGRVVYQSYPQRDIANVGATPGGVTTSYDDLGRATSVARNTDTGVKTSYTDYLAGFQTRQTNALGKATTQRFWALDDPGSAMLAGISAPEGVNVSIERDLLGKPLSIRRWGSARGFASDVTRSYVYDAFERLCKTLEPEVIATVQDYDDNGNVAWRAPGVNLPLSTCDRNGVPLAKKISYGYDEINQLLSVTYGDNSPSVTRTYKPDGLLATISSNGATWTYEYNSLRKLASESLSYAGKTYDIGWGYNSNGSLSALSYPAGGPVVFYSPNALGEPSQVSGYASGIAFHPNGAVSDFAFGNGIVHSLTQTTDGLPKLNAAGNVLKDLYSYDANGNIIGIDDLRTSPTDGSASRSMTYDDLDRLAGVNAPGTWGTATYVYDPVDNLRTAIVGTRSNAMAYADGTNRLTGLSTSMSGGAVTQMAYGYDVNGNISSKGAQAFTFDLGNRLRSASLGGTYTYDGHGRRIEMVSTDGSTRLQLYSQAGQLLWSEKTGAGSVQATPTYTCASGTRVGDQCVTTTTYQASVTYGCNAGDVRDGSSCTHTSSYAASASYNCPSGGSLSGSTCTIASTSYAATANYSCPNGGTLSGSTCTVASSSYGATATYSCPSGGALAGSTCTRNDDYTAAVTYSCPNGGTASGASCARTTYVTATTTYSCPPGYTLSGSTCSQTTAAPATATVTCNGYGSLWADGVTCMTYSLAVTYTSDDGWNACHAAANQRGLQLLNVESTGAKTRRCYFGAVPGPYSCPGGGTLNGSQCLTTTSQSATASYSCSTGTLTGAACAVTDTYTAAAAYSCPNGGTQDGTVCRKSTPYGAAVTYSCPSGGSVSGSSCTVPSSSYGASVSYSCPNGGSLDGSTCTLPSNSYGASASYSCPNGGTLSSGQCSTTNTYAASQTYGCTGSDVLNGSTCTHQSSVAATINWTCPDGGVVSGNQCTGASVTTKTAYVYLGTKAIAEVDSARGTQYLHTDALGSPVARTNATGAVINRTRYEPYGYIAAGVKPSPIVGTLGFTGHVQDAETDLVYMQQRYYDPIAGRFLSVDPVVTDANTGKGFGLYTYVDNNPYTKVDPDGKAGVLAVGIPLGIGVIAHQVMPGKSERERDIANGLRAVGNAIKNILKSEGDAKPEAPKDDKGGGNENTNPYNGPVTEPVVVVDQHGNAIPVDTGQSVSSSPNGDYQQVLGSDGKPTGDRMDRGGHKGQKDPKAQGPHGHRPGVTGPDGNPHLPIKGPTPKPESTQ